jgi:hypothetical protein
MLQMTHYKFFYIVLAIACFTTLLTGCNQSTVPPDSDNKFPNFKEIVGVEELPVDLKLEISTSINQIEDGSPIDLLLTNDSGYTIQFSPGYGSQLFAYDRATKAWIDVQNLVNYVGDGDLLGSKSEGSENWAAYLTVAPALPESHSYEILRIAVVGMATNKMGSELYPVGAFIDIPIGT